MNLKVSKLNEQFSCMSMRSMERFYRLAKSFQAPSLKILQNIDISHGHFLELFSSSLLEVFLTKISLGGDIPLINDHFLVESLHKSTSSWQKIEVNTTQINWLDGDSLSLSLENDSRFECR